MRLSFECPDCGRHELEEIVEGACVSSTVREILTPGAPRDRWDTRMEYGEAHHEDGSIVRYQCARCGWVLQDENANVIEKAEDLVRWLRQRGMLDVEA